MAVGGARVSLTPQLRDACATQERAGQGLAPAALALPDSSFPKRHQVLHSNSLGLVSVTLWAHEGAYI